MKLAACLLITLFFSSAYANLSQKNQPELVFTCELKNCLYDDETSGLKNIPLLQGWSIESIYFYTTAAGVKAVVPTINFTQLKTGDWFTLNPRQASSLMFDCFEFGKNGRLSNEENVCVPKDISDSNLENMVTLIEEIEVWRSKSYE